MIQSMVIGVRRNLVDAGVHYDDIPNEACLAWITAATAKWLFTTSEGLAHSAEKLQLETFTGNQENDYRIHDPVTGGMQEIKPEDITYFRGAAVQGQPIPFSTLAFSEKVRESCDGCGIVSHCLKTVCDPYEGDKLKSLCNYCITFHDHPRVNDNGGFSICQSCAKTSCKNKPR